MRLNRVLLVVLVAMTGACSRGTVSDEAPRGSAGAATPPTSSSDGVERPYLLEFVDDAAVVQLYADGFASLLREKTLIWHLSQATLAGRDIFIDQTHRNALEMRGVIEQIVAHPQGVDPAALREIQVYTKLFWINNGPYNNLTARKFVLKFTPQALAAAARFATRQGESLDAMLARLGPMFFDPNVDPILTNKTPGPGRDILTASANNLYSGVSMADLKGFTERDLTAQMLEYSGVRR